MPITKEDVSDLVLYMVEEERGKSDNITVTGINMDESNKGACTATAFFDLTVKNYGMESIYKYRATFDLARNDRGTIEVLSFTSNRLRNR